MIQFAYLFDGLGHDSDSYDSLFQQIDFDVTVISFVQFIARWSPKQFLKYKCMIEKSWLLIKYIFKKEEIANANKNERDFDPWSPVSGASNTSN